MTSAFLNRLSLNAPKNCVTKSGRKRRLRSSSGMAVLLAAFVPLTGYFVEGDDFAAVCLGLFASFGVIAHDLEFFQLAERLGNLVRQRLHRLVQPRDLGGDALLALPDALGEPAEEMRHLG